MKSHLTPSVAISELKKDCSRTQDGPMNRTSQTVTHRDRSACLPKVGRRARFRTKEWRISCPTKMTGTCPGDKLLCLVLSVNFLPSLPRGQGRKDVLKAHGLRFAGKLCRVPFGLFQFAAACACKASSFHSMPSEAEPGSCLFFHSSSTSG